MSEFSQYPYGRDFWFTRQRHGVGFWDREELNDDAKEKAREWFRTDYDFVWLIWGDNDPDLSNLCPSDF